jgi:hypothetical protein
MAGARELASIISIININNIAILTTRVKSEDRAME